MHTVTFSILTAHIASREIYRNDTDYSTKGSLIWILDKTSTKFGARLLRSWVGKPLIDPQYVLSPYDIDCFLASLCSQSTPRAY